MKREKDIAAWKDEIALFAKEVEAETGNELTAENLARAIRTINEKRRALARVFEARKADPVPISGKDCPAHDADRVLRRPGALRRDGEPSWPTSWKRASSAARAWCPPARSAS